MLPPRRSRAAAAGRSRRRRGGIASTPRGLVASIPWSGRAAAAGGVAPPPRRGRAAAAGRSPRRARPERRVPTVDFGAGADATPRRDVAGNYEKAPSVAAGAGAAVAAEGAFCQAQHKIIQYCLAFAAAELAAGDRSGTESCASPSNGALPHRSTRPRRQPGARCLPRRGPSSPARRALTRRRARADWWRRRRRRRARRRRSPAATWRRRRRWRRGPAARRSEI